MIKNQKFFMSLLCVIGLGFAQVAWGLGEEFQAKAPVSDVAAKMQGSADEDPNADYDRPENIAARNAARQAVGQEQQARVDKVTSMTGFQFFSKMSHVKLSRNLNDKDSVSVSEFWSGQPDSLSVDRAKKMAVSNIIDEQFPQPKEDVNDDVVEVDSDSTRNQRITEQAQAAKEQADKEAKFVQDLPPSIKNLNLEQLNEKDASGNLTMSLNTLLAVAKKYDVELLDISFEKYYHRKFSDSGLNWTFKDVGFELLLGLPVKFTDFEQKNQLIKFNKSMQNGAKEFLINRVSQEFIQNLPSSIDEANLNFLNATDASGNLLMNTSVFYNVANKYLQYSDATAEAILSKVYAENDKGKRLTSFDVYDVQTMLTTGILSEDSRYDNASGQEKLKIIKDLNNSVEFQNKLKEAFKTAIFDKQRKAKLVVEQQEAAARAQ